MLNSMPRLYGDRITDVESTELIAKLRARGTSEATIAADTVGRGPSRDTTVATSLQARHAILLELRDWEDLDEKSPGLAGLRDRLSAPQQGSRII
jgi:hypothetical protein